MAARTLCHSSMEPSSLESLHCSYKRQTLAVVRHDHCRTSRSSRLYRRSHGHMHMALTWVNAIRRRRRRRFKGTNQRCTIRDLETGLLPSLQHSPWWTSTAPITVQQNRSIPWLQCPLLSKFLRRFALKDIRRVLSENGQELEGTAKKKRQYV